MQKLAGDALARLCKASSAGYGNWKRNSANWMSRSYGTRRREIGVGAMPEEHFETAVETAKATAGDVGGPSSARQPIARNRLPTPPNVGVGGYRGAVSVVDDALAVLAGFSRHGPHGTGSVRVYSIL